MYRNGRASRDCKEIELKDGIIVAARDDSFGLFENYEPSATLDMSWGHRISIHQRRYFSGDFSFRRNRRFDFTM